MIVRVANGHSRTLSRAGRVEEARHNYPDLTVSKFKQAMVFFSAALNRQKISENSSCPTD
jgi:hypothetical protein